jgi:hypothetical protein
MAQPSGQLNNGQCWHSNQQDDQSQQSQQASTQQGMAYQQWYAQMQNMFHTAAHQQEQQMQLQQLNQPIGYQPVMQQPPQTPMGYAQTANVMQAQTRQLQMQVQMLQQQVAYQYMNQQPMHSQPQHMGHQPMNQHPTYQQATNHPIPTQNQQTGASGDGGVIGTVWSTRNGMTEHETAQPEDWPCEQKDNDRPAGEELDDDEATRTPSWMSLIADDQRMECQLVKPEHSRQDCPFGFDCEKAHELYVRFLKGQLGVEPEDIAYGKFSDILDMDGVDGCSGHEDKVVEVAAGQDIKPEPKPAAEDELS